MTTLLLVSTGLTIWCGIAILAYALCVSAARGDAELVEPFDASERDARFVRDPAYELTPTSARLRHS